MRINLDFGRKMLFLKNGETDYEDVALRIAGRVATAEEKVNQDKWKQAFFEMICGGYFVPAGRIFRDAGMLINCYALPVADDIYSIGELYKNVTVISSYGGGIGINFSDLRPEGAEIKTKGGEASGPVSFMKVVDTIGGNVCSGGQRRAALMAVLNVDHPDIYKFISAKLDHKVLNNFNISVGITDDFIHAVRNNRNWDLKFAGKIYQTIKAKELWNYITDCMLRSAEPGIVNLSAHRHWNNSFYFENIVTPVNPCGEITLPPYGVCVLGSLNWHQFVRDWQFDYEQLRAIVPTAIRFLDNVISVTEFPLHENKEAAERSRRIGLGIIGFHHALIELGIKYGSDECIEFIEKTMTVIRDSAYLTSCQLAEEKGTFTAYSPEYLNSAFIKTLPRKVQNKIKSVGIRNVAMLTAPPTGDTSLFTGLPHGIEPIPGKVFYRGEKKFVDPLYEKALAWKIECGLMGDKKLIDPLYEKYDDNPKWKDVFVGMYDVLPREHLAVQAEFQKYIDNSIAKTVNILPKNTDCFSELLLSQIHNLKGTTIYVKGTRPELITVPDEDIGECRGGACLIGETREESE